jgi:hypothetical protein
MHSLGFNTLIQENGEYKYNTSTELEAVFVPVEFPNSFDRQLYLGSTGENITEQLTQSQRANAVRSNNLFALLVVPIQIC